MGSFTHGFIHSDKLPWFLLGGRAAPAGNRLLLRSVHRRTKLLFATAANRLGLLIWVAILAKARADREFSAELRFSPVLGVAGMYHHAWPVAGFLFFLCVCPFATPPVRPFEGSASQTTDAWLEMLAWILFSSKWFQLGWKRAGFGKSNAFFSFFRFPFLPPPPPPRRTKV